MGRATALLDAASEGISYVRMAWCIFALVVVTVVAVPAALAQEALEVITIPQPDGSLIVVVPPESVKRCESEGGCRIVTGNELEGFVTEIYRQAKNSCTSSM